MDLKELSSGVDPAAHWYYQSKSQLLVSYIRRVHAARRRPLTVVDIGSGSGFFMYDLQRVAPEVIAKIYLVDIGYSESEVAATAGQRIEKCRITPAIQDAVVLLMDVLEHIEDDGLFLNDLHSRAHGNNHFFVTVPAFTSLWSRHDEFLGHYRRYTLGSLLRVLRQSGFQVEKSYYFYLCLLPFVWLVRRFRPAGQQPQSDMKAVNPWLNALLRTICRAEFPIRRLNRAVGVTCVAEGTFGSSETDG